MAAVVTTLVSAFPVAADPFGASDITGEPRSELIRPRFFGMGMETYRPQWPTVRVPTVRLNTMWPSVERQPGLFNWTVLDGQVATAQEHGARPLLILNGTPHFHAVRRAAKIPAPPDLHAYRVFARALVARYGAGVDYQVWNEPNVSIFYTGTPEHMARMTYILNRAVRTVAPRASVVAPSFVLRGEGRYPRRWFKRYWSAEANGRPVTRLVDVATISAYPMPDEDPEDGLAITQWAQRVVAKLGFGGDVWVTEINYGGTGGVPAVPQPMRTQVSNVVRTYVVHAALGADRVFWYSWNNDMSVNTHLQDGQGVLTPAGDAYGVVQEWLVGMRPSGCSVTRGVSTCTFRSARVIRAISWTRSGRIRTIRAPEGARKRTNPAGVDSRIREGDLVRVGITPVMIEARRRR